MAIADGGVGALYSFVSVGAVGVGVAASVGLLIGDVIALRCVWCHRLGAVGVKDCSNWSCRRRSCVGVVCVGAVGASVLEQWAPLVLKSWAPCRR